MDTVTVLIALTALGLSLYNFFQDCVTLMLIVVLDYTSFFDNRGNAVNTVVVRMITVGRKGGTVVVSNCVVKFSVVSRSSVRTLISWVPRDGNVLETNSPEMGNGLTIAPGDWAFDIPFPDAIINLSKHGQTLGDHQVIEVFAIAEDEAGKTYRSRSVAWDRHDIFPSIAR